MMAMMMKMIFLVTKMMVTMYDGDIDDNDDNEEEDTFGHKDDGHNV